MAIDFSTYSIGSASLLTDNVNATVGSRRCGSIYKYYNDYRNEALTNNGVSQTRYKGNPNADIKMVDGGVDIGEYVNVYNIESKRPVMKDYPDYDLYDITHSFQSMAGLNSEVKGRFNEDNGVLAMAQASTMTNGVRNYIDFIGNGDGKFSEIYGESNFTTYTNGGNLRNRLAEYLVNMLGGITLDITPSEGAMNQYDTHKTNLGVLTAMDDLAYSLDRFSVFGVNNTPVFYGVNPILDSSNVKTMMVFTDNIPMPFYSETNLERYRGLNRLAGFYQDIVDGASTTNSTLEEAINNAKSQKANYIGESELAFSNEYYAKESVLPDIDNLLENDKRAESYSAGKGVNSTSDYSDKGNSRSYYLYNERSEGDGHTLDFNVNNDGNVATDFVPLSLSSEESTMDNNSLLRRTNEMFKNGKIGSLINRFHTKQLNGTDELTTAVDSEYGMSRGRNLKKIGKTQHYGYDNPYCRVWTSIHQYSKLQNLIRPFTEGRGIMTPDSISKKLGSLRTEKRGKSFTNLSSMEEVGVPRIAPHSKSDVKKCMFSIENLAWKDINFNARIDTSGGPMVLSEEQRGPNGGRIMWFPPYNLKFTENVSTQWEGNQFIGRGEQIYTYVNTDRSGTLSFTMLVDHPSIVDRWARGISTATEENEQTLLRFYAGCEMLEPTGKNAACDKAATDKNKKQTDALTSTPNLSVQDGAETERYYVFFPNDFSGIDYTKSGKDVQTAIDYLLNGYDGYANVGYEIDGTNPDLGCIDGETYEQMGKNKVMQTWHYQPDVKLGNEVLINNDEIDNYTNSTNYSLNSAFPEIAYGDGPYEESADEVSAANRKKAKTVFGLGAVDSGTVHSFEELLDIASKYADVDTNEYDFDIQVKGYASSHGYDSSNDSLSKNRARTIKKYIEKLNVFPIENSYGQETTRVVDSGTLELTPGNQDVNSFEAKLARSVEVVIKKTLKGTAGPILDSAEGGATVSEDRGTENGSAESNVTAGSNSVCREVDDSEDTFDNEYKYFEQLAIEDPMLRNNIVEKVKFFDPAYHSITPEGFNGRLSFLHQCTRQGPTTSVSEGTNTGMGAGNLAFGRPPICVLRIGDFYNTKIVIDSISIDYGDGGGMQWDLNPEGIGLQPMMANVNISFKFLGGSDLGGPIERLQNAVSSNYYANESIYNHRSDYKESAGATVHTWTPDFSDSGSNIIEHKSYNFED